MLWTCCQHVSLASESLCILRAFFPHNSVGFEECFFFCKTRIKKKSESKYDSCFIILFNFFGGNWKCFVAMHYVLVRICCMNNTRRAISVKFSIQLVHIYRFYFTHKNKNKKNLTKRKKNRCLAVGLCLHVWVVSSAHRHHQHTQTWFRF